MHDKISKVILFNEPTVFIELGYLLGIFAPGISDSQTFLNSIHNINLAHGKALSAIRAKYSHIQLGSSFTYDPVHSVSNDPKDIRAADLYRDYWHECFLGTTMKGAYPASFMPYLEKDIKSGDMEIISQKQDFIGLNHYRSIYVKAVEGKFFGNQSLTDPFNTELEKTDSNWTINPQAFFGSLMSIRNHYGNPDLYVTENGCAFNDDLVEDGKVHDERRIKFYESYLRAMNKAIAQGVNIKGYFAWSFMDNFEWSSGYSMRYGLTYIDYKSLKRTPKDSFYWYKDYVKSNIC